MRIRITGRNVEITPGLQSYADKRLSGLERYARGLVVGDPQLVVWEERGQYGGEFLLKIKGKTLKVETSGKKDPLELIDELKDIAKRQLEKENEKLRERRRRA